MAEILKIVYAFIIMISVILGQHSKSIFTQISIFLLYHMKNIPSSSSNIHVLLLKYRFNPMQN